MTVVNIPAGTLNWDVPVNSNFADLQSQTDALTASITVGLGGKLNLSGGTMTGTITGAPNVDAFVTDSNTRSAFFKTTSTTNHVLTVFQAGTSGVDTAAALNVVSNNKDTSAMFLNGTEDSRGTFKVAHRNPGSGAVADANGSAISIDLQYNGQGGTAARGLFMTGTDGPTTGDLITLRNNSRDDFVVKANGSVGIRLATASTPAGALEIRQVDTSTVGLAMTAQSGGLQMILLKDSGGNARFEVNASGNAIFRANMLSTAPFQMGSTTADFGGLTGSGISMKAATAVPTTNPTGGAIIYVDSSGNLLCRTQAGNVRTIAAV